jgi:hypothetical protein
MQEGVLHMVQARLLGILLLLSLGAAKQDGTFIRHLRKANEYVIAHTRYHTHRLPKVVWLSRAQMNKRSADDDALCHDDSDGVTDAMEDDGSCILQKVSSSSGVTIKPSCMSWFISNKILIRTYLTAWVSRRRKPMA